ncbi:hypothetical protein K0M31_003263 [Melipona bicolor]|uniref:Secreted protein n=1 Tax=Melipona bicolor TaxID=60889 RepID=A0AA40FYK9_9HYME|nr:hypothetical protein K0M31_003263 [Melipona bicolor]
MDLKFFMFLITVQVAVAKVFTPLLVNSWPNVISQLHEFLTDIGVVSFTSSNFYENLLYICCAQHELQITRDMHRNERGRGVGTLNILVPFEEVSVFYAAWKRRRNRVWAPRPPWTAPVIYVAASRWCATTDEMMLTGAARSHRTI